MMTGTTTAMILNLGAGYDIRPDAVNVDVRPLPRIDMVFDLDTHPWFALPSDYFDEVLALDVFEHLADVVGAMDECWRVLKPGGTLTVRGPTPDSPNLWVDVTHRRAFTEHSFDHFDWTTDMGSKFRYGKHPWKVSLGPPVKDAIVFIMEPIK